MNYNRIFQERMKDRYPDGFRMISNSHGFCTEPGCFELCLWYSGKCYRFCEKHLPTVIQDSEKEMYGIKYRYFCQCGKNKNPSWGFPEENSLRVCCESCKVPGMIDLTSIES
jgi:hypothetical protein